MNIDITITNEGSLMMFHAHSEGARHWLRENTDGQWLGWALAVEPRYAARLADGLLEEGFIIG